MKLRVLRFRLRSSRRAFAFWNFAPRWIDCAWVLTAGHDAFEALAKESGPYQVLYTGLLMEKLTGIHAVREALEAERPFDRILIARGRQDTRVEEIVQLARARDIPVRFEDRSQLDRLANSKDHQGVVALAAARTPATLESILAAANKSPGHGSNGLIVLLDGVEDPHNLGAIIRTSLAAGAHGVVIP